jgi:regulator of nucleoside diphosphate kinase
MKHQQALTITITDLDAKRLSALLMTRVGLAYRNEARRLRETLRRATIVDSRSVAGDVVTMRSKVVYEDLTSGKTKEVTIVYPWSGHERSTTNVLSPVGTALLGLRVGDRISWALEDATTMVLRVLALPYQPEAAGHWHL